jgi:hypothetical protein
VRLPALLWAVILPSAAAADRLIDIPTASKLPFGDLRLEYADETSGGRTQLGWLEAGISTSFEAELRTEQYSGRSLDGTFDISYVYISPLADISPGLAAGVQDVLGTTVDGRRYYMCATFRNSVEAIGGEYPSDITLGFYLGAHPSPFVGTSIPFSSNFRLLAEHDGIRISAGFEYSPIRATALRLLVRGQDILADVSFRGRF